MIFRRKNCLSCYFCSKVYERHPFSLKPTERAKATKSDFSFLNAGIEKDVYMLECVKGQWSEGVQSSNKDLRKSLRGRRCSFYCSFEDGDGKMFSSIDEEVHLLAQIRTEGRARKALLISLVAVIISILNFLGVSKQMLVSFLSGISWK